MTKKVLAVSLVLCLVFAASSAIAQPRRQMQPQMPPQRAPQYDYGYCPQGWGDWNRQPQNFDRPERFCGRDCGPEFGPRGFGPRGFNDPEMPKEIRAIAVEVAKLRIDLNEALNSNPMDKEKAFEIHDKIMKLEQDIERWKFVKRVDRIEAFRRQRELNRNYRPTQNPPENPNTPPQTTTPNPENNQ